MPNAEKVNCDKCLGTGAADYAGFSMSMCRWCNGTGTAVASSHGRSGKSLDSLGADGQEVATIKDNLTVEPVNNRYKFTDQCFACGSLPCDQSENPWQSLPWIVHFDMAHFPRFLIDGRDPNNPDMFLGYKINGSGEVAKQSLTTGEGGRMAFHRSHFVEELPA